MPAGEPSDATPEPPADHLRTAGAVPRLHVPGPTDASTQSGSAWKHATKADSISDSLTLYEHFEILRREDGSLWRLGRGAMGTTYKALDTRLHHHVALKVISSELTSYPAARTRFLREARTAACLHHPNVARVFHLGETAGGAEAFYAMEFVEGETLEARVRRMGPLSVWLVMEIGIEVARALVAACHQDLIHRDLKPANLMLVSAAEASILAAVGSESSHGEMGEAWVKVIDFGLAKAVADAGPLTGVGDFIGTPAYASPEQFESKGGSVDSRSDIYSLGGTLWYALTGKMPFGGKSLTEIHAQKLSRAAPLAQLHAAGVPAPLVRLLASMLAADSGDRPQTPTLLLEALRRCREELRRLSSAGPERLATGSSSWEPLRTGRRVGFVLLALAPAAAFAGYFLWQRPPAVGPRAAQAGSVHEETTRTDAADTFVPAKSIAVLPFQNFSADKGDVYFADGMQDEILTDLAKVADLKVISRTSVAQYKTGEPHNLREIAAQLGVANVLEGSVQRAGDKIRVTVQLIDARTDTHRWAEHFDRPLDDVFAIQSEIAQAVAGQLQARLSPQEKGAIDRAPTRDLAAYDLYLRAREQQQLYFKVSDDIRRNAHREIALLDQAVARDPEFVLAYCELAKAHDQLHYYKPSRLDESFPVDHRSSAEAALAAARRLQPDSGEVHLAQATHFLYTQGDLAQARVEADIALRALPGDAWAKCVTGAIARRQGRWAEAVRFLEEAVTLEPRDPNMLDRLAHLYRSLRRYADLDGTEARILAILPPRDATDARLERALGRLEASGDTAPLRAAIAATPSGEVDASDLEVIEDCRIALAVLERDAKALSSLVENTTRRQGILSYGIRYPLAFYQALAAAMRHDHAGEQIAFKAARVEAEKTVLADSGDGLALSLLAIIDVRLGHAEEALREARRACELVSPEKNPIEAANVASNLIVVYAWTQRADLAIEELSKWLEPDRPAGDGVVARLSYGDLRLNPLYDPLQSDPRFIALLRRLAPLASH